MNELTRKHGLGRIKYMAPPNFRNNPLAWAGVLNVMDGAPVEPGCYFDYHFRIVNPPGTHMYHTHHNASMQEMMGLGGGFIILDPGETDILHDYFIMLQEFTVKGLEMGEVNPGIYDIDPFSHNANFFTMNGRCLPYTTSLITSYGEKVRIRLGNIVEDAHPIHIHRQQFSVTAADGNTIPVNNRLLKNTILVASGETWDIEFQANNSGIWPFHCHIPHHMDNNMREETGGMFTTIVYEDCL